MLVTHGSLRFDVRVDGDGGRETVLLLHGFPGGRTTWSTLVPRLVHEGHRVLTFEQRGYASSARPAGVHDYGIDLLTDDVAAVIDEFGAPVHIVAHDWGSLVAWRLAACQPELVTSLVALSTPHPAAVIRSFAASTQLMRSAYAGWFQLPVLPEAGLLAADGRAMRWMLERSGLSSDWARTYVAAMQQPGRLTAALHWYRAAARHPGRMGSTPGVTVPTALVWGDCDVTMARHAVDGTARWVHAPYELTVLAGCGHWIPELHVHVAWPAIVGHLRRFSASRRVGRTGGPGAVSSQPRTRRPQAQRGSAR